MARDGPLVWSVCRSISRDSHAAEDAFQATFLILVRKAGSIRRRENLGTWLHGVARRVAVRAKTTTARRLRQEVRGAQMKGASEPDPTPTRDEEIAALHEEIGRLPEKYRSAVVLCHLEGRTHAEAARVLNCPSGTISIRVSRARELLRQRLVRRGVAVSTVLASTTLASETTTAAMPVGLAETTIEAAMHFAAGPASTAGAVSAAVSHLTEGVLRTMTLTRITLASALVLTTVSVTSGIGILVTGLPQVKARGLQDVAGQAQDQPAEKAKAGEDKAKERKAREQMEKNLKMIGLAMHNVVSEGQRFPPAAIRSKDGKPLLSWRVAILPYVEQKPLYEKFHLDEPWDSPHNKTLLKEIPSVYAPVVRGAEPRISTYFQVFTGPGTLFDDKLGTKISDVFDGVSNTLVVVEAATPVPWTKPEDLEYDKDKPLPKLRGQFRDGFPAVFADGSVILLRKSIAPETLRALITRNGGEVLSYDSFRAEPAPGQGPLREPLQPPTKRQDD